MNKLKIAICDDEKIALNIVAEAVKTICESHGVQTQIEKFFSTGDLEERMKGFSFDLLFLDIMIPGTSGIEFGEKLRANNSAADIIFISNSEEKVFEALKIHPFSFIRKSCLLKDITAALDLYITSKPHEKKQKNILLKTRNGIGSFLIDQILYIEGDKQFQLMHTKESKQTITVCSSMMQLESGLSEYGFYRTHKGFIINFSYVHLLNAKGVTMENGDIIPISRGKIKELMLAYVTYSNDKESIIF